METSDVLSEPATADPPMLDVNLQMAFPLSDELLGNGLDQFKVRINRKRRSPEERRAAQDRDQALQLAQSDLFMQAFKRLFPNEGTNAYDWSGLAQDLHIAMLSDVLDDILDPSCRFGSEKHAELWTWIHGIDRACRIPFSFDVCCAYAEENPDDLRDLLQPYFVRQPGVANPRRLSQQALAQAHELTWDQWRCAQRVYRAVVACIDEARTH